MTEGTLDPHAGAVWLHHGPRPAEARVTLLCLHGRGASASDILRLAAELRLDDVACLAPQASGRTWYPHTFLAPLDQNEPALGSALRLVSGAIDGLVADGVGVGRIGLIGFSQGACLSLEFAARHARRYAGVFGLSGGLIGPPGTPRAYTGSLDGTPVFLGCSDVDVHIPLARVHETADVLRGLGAAVDERIYPGMGHTVNGDEIAAIRAVLQR
ncbi:MAG: dienelactone hydrolase family protein [Acidobacteria bacterium]|nr:dienelactone hydrolase family protein [Acidobacteriota bacterium]